MLSEIFYAASKTKSIGQLQVPDQRLQFREIVRFQHISRDAERRFGKMCRNGRSGSDKHIMPLHPANFANRRDESLAIVFCSLGDRIPVCQIETVVDRLY